MLQNHSFVSVEACPLSSRFSNGENRARWFNWAQSTTNILGETHPDSVGPQAHPLTKSLQREKERKKGTPNLKTRSTFLSRRTNLKGFLRQKELVSLFPLFQVEISFFGWLMASHAHMRERCSTLRSLPAFYWTFWGQPFFQCFPLSFSIWIGTPDTLLRFPYIYMYTYILF